MDQQRGLKSRYEFGDLLSVLKLKTGVEVGTQRGDFSKVLLQRWHCCTEFHVVDVWKHQSNYLDGANVADRQQDECFQAAMLNLQPWLSSQVLKVHCKLSTQAARDIATNRAVSCGDDGCLDFVYLDARHDYQGVTEDLQAYWPLLKRGGIMAGHDFLDSDEHKRWNPADDWSVQSDGTRRWDNKAVKGAVLDFFALASVADQPTRSVYVTTDDGPWRSWFVFK